MGLLGAFVTAGGKGIAAPSANRFGQVSPTNAGAVVEEIGEYLSESDFILDGGQSEVGLESTIIDCTGEVPKVLRPGAITISMIKETTGLDVANSVGQKIEDSGVEPIRVSGSLDSHYAPQASVFLDRQPTAGAGFIALDSFDTPAGVIRLAAPRSVDEFAQVLYSALRDGDNQMLDSIFIAQPTGDGIAIAIRDRLSRAAKG